MGQTGKKRQFIVMGLGRFGRSVAQTLHDMGYMVLGIDRDEAIVQSASAGLTNVMQFDIRDADALSEIDVGQFDAAVIAVKELESSLMCTMLCQEAGIKEIVVKAINERHAKMAENLGATRIIFSERDTGRQVAHRLALSNVLNYVELDDSIHIVTIKVPQEFLGKNLAEMEFRKRYHLNVVAVRTQETVMLPPDPKRAFQEEDQLVLIGQKEYFKRFEAE